MVEGGIIKVDKSDITECWRTTWRTPYILRLAFSAGIGGFLFGYDTGVISGALLYIRDDFHSVDKNTLLQETIVSMAVAGAIFGAAIGGWINDKFGRRPSLLTADVLFFAGAILMATAPAPWLIILGRISVGLGVGMASMTSPLYISEASPHRIRGALVSMNGLLITGGQFLSYLINLAFSFTKAHGAWRWMLGIAGVPPAVQFLLMLSLPESPRWLYRKNRVDKARAILERIYPAAEVENEMEALRSSIEAEKAEDGAVGDASIFKQVCKAWSTPAVRRALYAGITVQVVQQFVGINTVLYYSPTIMQFAGFPSNRTALALSLVTAGLNAVGTIVSMMFVDKYGRRRLMLISLFGIIACLVVLSGVFFQAGNQAPPISRIESNLFGANSTCSTYMQAPDASSWNCMKCIENSDCGFCSNGANKVSGPGACLDLQDNLKTACRAQHHGTWYTKGCPSKVGFLAVVFLGLYIICYAPGMGTVPWIVNSEIYPLKYRGIGGGMAAVANWSSNLVVSLTFLSLTKALGTPGTFLLFAGFSFLGLVAIFFLVPETKGLPFDEVERLLQRGFSPFRKNNNPTSKEGTAS